MAQRKRFFTLLAVLGLTLTFQASAQTGSLESETRPNFGMRPGAFSFSTGLGAYFNGEGQTFINRAERWRHIWAYGVRFSYVVSPIFEIETKYTFSPTRANTLKQNMFDYTGHLILNYPNAKRLVPYLNLGLGGIAVAIENDPRITHKFAINYGLGLKFFVTPQFALRPEILALSSFDDQHTAFLATFMFTYYTRGRAFDKTKQRRNGQDDFSDRTGSAQNVSEASTNPDDDSTPRIEIAESFRQEAVENTTDFTSAEDQCPDMPGIQTDSEACPDATPIEVKTNQIISEEDDCIKQLKAANGGKVSSRCLSKPVPEELQPYVGKIEGILFSSDSAVLRQESYPKLREAVTLFKKYPQLYVLVEGHTDSVGRRKYNVALSLQRAKAVSEFLIAEGIEPFRVAIQGMGPDKPVDDNATPDGRARNRRIEFKLLLRSQ